MASTGTVAVTFESLAAATTCASSLHGRWFDARLIEVKVVAPQSVTGSNVNAVYHDDGYHTVHDEGEDEGSFPNRDERGGDIYSIYGPGGAETETDTPATSVDVKEVEGEVEDFLNSLL